MEKKDDGHGGSSSDPLTEYIREHFSYCNGVIVRDDRSNSGGSYDKDGYLILKVKGRQFKAHRVAWLLCTGSWPEGEIDHINHVRDDNRIENLRVVTRADNNRNRRPKINKDTGVVGIYLDKSTPGLRSRYAFSANGKTFRFRTLEEAAEKRRELLS